MKSKLEIDLEAKLKIEPPQFAELNEYEELTTKRDESIRVKEEIYIRIAELKANNEKVMASLMKRMFKLNKTKHIKTTLRDFESITCPLMRLHELETKYEKIKGKIIEYNNTRNDAKTYLLYLEELKVLNSTIDEHKTRIANLEQKIKNLEKSRYELIRVKNVEICSILDEFSGFFPISRIHMSIVTNIESGLKLEFMIRPDDDGYRSVHLLSGGQKALSFSLFKLAIAKISKTPLIFLDEIDANMDVIAISELVTLLMTIDVQIIAISLRNIFFNAANSIIGVWRDEEEKSNVLIERMILDE